ncbi:MAG: CHAT domain-containing protein, partial [bacterium]|nr:CHAT domain-containing protein [bacterium]
GNTWLGEADVLFRLGDNDGALSAYRNARKLFEAVGSQLGEGNTWDGEADVLFRLGDNDGALSAYRNARKLFEAVGSQLGQGNTWRGEAEVLLRGGRAGEAAEAAVRGAELAASQAAQGSEILALLVEARARLQLAELDRVVEVTERAIKRFDQRRGGFVTDAQRTGQESIINRAYELLIPTLWQLGRPLAALERAEQARSRVLLDLVATHHATRSRQADVALDLLQQREELASELATIAGELSEEPPPERRRELEQNRAVLDAQAERLGFESLLSAGSPLASAESLDPEGIRSTVHEVGPILLYYVAAEQTFVFLILRDDPEPVARVLDLSWGELGQRARQLAEALANPNYEHRAEELTRELGTALLGPLSDHLPPGGPLTLILHGPLHQVPFESLVDPEGKPLLERFDLAVVPSISTLHHVRARHRPPRADDGLLALASGTGLTLPAVEIRKIAAFFDPTQAADFAPAMARYRTYENLAPRARHLLIASQGAHSPGSRRLTYLEIERSDAHDGRLTAAEIAGLPIDAELVTLAACDTAYAEALLSDERLDLTRAYLVAGAAAVLATRWKVPEDYRTSRFLVDFYRAYRQGGPEGRGLRKDQALTEARRRSRERDDPPQIWAAWVLVGDAR